jgi:inosine/xanthosine triphosphatase
VERSETVAGRGHRPSEGQRLRRASRRSTLHGYVPASKISSDSLFVQTSNSRPASMHLVVVGSSNPVKIAAVRAVIERLWPTCSVRGFPVESGVSAQPLGDEETQRGAQSRARRALADCADADLAVGLEGGVVISANGAMRTCAWAATVDRRGNEGLGGSLAVPLPEVVAARIRAGEELGHAMDTVSQSIGTKFGRGAVGILTAGLIDRQRAYEPLVTYALAPWLAPDYFEVSGR